MARIDRLTTLIGLLIIAVGTAQFMLGVALTTDFGAALAGAFGWHLGNNRDPYPIGNPLLMLLAWLLGSIIARDGIVMGRSKLSHWV